MKAVKIIFDEPFGRAKREEIDVGVKIKKLAPRMSYPFIAMLNGKPTLRKDWNRRLRSGDVLIFAAQPLGGNGGSDPMRVVLMLGMGFAGMYGAGLLAQGGMLGAEAAAVAAGGTSALGSAIIGVTGAAISLGGMAIINAVMPMEYDTGGMGSIPTPSPTYSINAQGNAARIGSVIPVQYGRMRFTPDYAALPYVEYFDNDQYLYSLMCLGQGYFEIEKIQIEDSDISAFEEITYEVLDPGEYLTLFPANVITSGEVSGQDLPAKVSGTYSQSGTTVTVTKSSHGLTVGNYIYADFTSGTASDGIYEIATAPTIDTFTVTSGTSATTSGNVSYSQFKGPFVANNSDTQIHALAIDLVFPQGIFKFDSGMTAWSTGWDVYYRAIDDDGLPTGAWVGLQSGTLGGSSNTPQRRSYRFDVAPGRYEVMARRNTTSSGSGSYGESVAWSGLRGYLPETRNFGNVTMLAMRMKATNNLSMQASRKVFVTATRILNNAMCDNIPTRHLAHALLDICLNSDYGLGLSESNIDLTELSALDETWQSRGDNLDIRFDSETTAGEALNIVAQCGRAKWYQAGTKVRFFRDELQTVPEILYTARSIRDLEVETILPTDDTSDCIDVTYFDSTSWVQRTVRAALPGSAEAKPTSIELRGITDRDHALREGLYRCAANLRRQLVKFTTDAAGYIPVPGSLVALQHDMPGWGQSGEVIGWNAGTLTATLSEMLTWETGETHYIALRAADGSVDGPHVVTQGDALNKVVFAELPDVTPYTKGGKKRTEFTFGWDNNWRAEMIVTSINPTGPFEVSVSGVINDVEVHSADIGASAGSMEYSQLPNLYTTPNVSGLKLAQSSIDASIAMLSWEASPGASNYLIETSADGILWTRIADTTANNISVKVDYGIDTLFRVAAIGMTKGAWVTVTFAGVADYFYGSTSEPFYGADGDLFYGGF